MQAQTLLSAGRMGCPHNELIKSLLRERTELCVLADGVSFAVGHACDGPFRVPDATQIDLSPGVLRPGPALTVYVRHALEVAVWHRLAPRPRGAATELAASALAGATALRYVDTLPAADAAIAIEALPGPMQRVYRLMRESRCENRPARIARALAALGSRLLPLQGVAACGATADPKAIATAAALVEELLAIACPTEWLWTTGGDSRLTLDAGSRVNKYGCGAVPRPSTIAFSSCTASSPSELSYRAAEHARCRLLASALAASTGAATFEEEMEQARTSLAALLRVPAGSGAEIVLAASGTDCELYALQLALAGHRQDLLAIVIGPDEIGSGSLAAAGGRHFDTVAPLAGSVAVGKPIEGLDVNRMRVEPLPVRDDTGNPIPLPELDAAVERLAHIASQQRARVLVHLVDGSKTGLRAPSAAALRRLQRRLGEALTVVVDAAQMRVGIEQLREYLENGWLVMISGSKFFGGPPFSGALLVPPGIAQRARQMNPVPPGLASYLSAFDVPRSWRSWRAALPATPNVGLLLRWRAALAEMRAFHALDRGVREERLRHLSRRLHDEVRSRRFLEPVRSSLGDREDAATIATFVLKRPDPTRARRVLDFDEAWQLYTWLNRDMAAMLPPYATHSERRAAAMAFHIGQPVRIRRSDGDVAGALRVALGARSLRTDADDLRGVFDKIELILNYWPTLTAQPAVA